MWSWSKRSTKRLTASGAGVGMLQKVMSEEPQVKAWRRPRSVEFAFAFHVGEQGDDFLLHSRERIGRESMLIGPRIELGHRFVTPDGPGLARAAQGTEDLAAERIETYRQRISAPYPQFVQNIVPGPLQPPLPADCPSLT